MKRECKEGLELRSYGDFPNVPEEALGTMLALLGRHALFRSLVRRGECRVCQNAHSLRYKVANGISNMRQSVSHLTHYLSPRLTLRQTAQNLLRLAQEGPTPLCLSRSGS